jgi:hypothetical protein
MKEQGLRQDSEAATLVPNLETQPWNPTLEPSLGT